jgi:hypothetical protein
MAFTFRYRFEKPDDSLPKPATVRHGVRATSQAANRVAYDQPSNCDESILDSSQQFVEFSLLRACATSRREPGRFPPSARH